MVEERQCELVMIIFFFQAEDGIRDWSVTGVQTCALPISFLLKSISSSQIKLSGKFTSLSNKKMTISFLWLPFAGLNDDEGEERELSERPF